MSCTRTKRRNLLAILVPLVLVPETAKADWLLLLHADASGKLGQDWEGKVETEVKFRNNMSEYYDLEAMPWVAYRLTEWFRMGLGWRELFSRKDAEIFSGEVTSDSETPSLRRVSDHYWWVEHRPLTDFMFAAKPWHVTLEDRVRVEFRNFQGQPGYFRYRNRVRFRPPWTWTKAELQPWLAWEAYYEDNRDWAAGDRLNRHRLYVGLAAKLTGTVRVGSYYYWERVLLSGAWVSNNEIGLEAGFTLGEGERPAGAVQRSGGRHIPQRGGSGDQSN